MSKLRKIKFPMQLNSDNIMKGMACEYLPIINYVLLEFSPLVASVISEAGFDLYGKKDYRFMEVVLK